MKTGLSIFRFTIILFITAFVITVANVPEASSVESTSTHPKDDSYSASANEMLKPANTESPRATLQSFIENMNRAYSVLMKAHRENLKTPGFFTSESVRQMATQAQDLFERGVECLNLSKNPGARLHASTPLSMTDWFNVFRSTRARRQKYDHSPGEDSFGGDCFTLARAGCLWRSPA